MFCFPPPILFYQGLCIHLQIQITEAAQGSLRDRVFVMSCCPVMDINVEICCFRATGLGLCIFKWCFGVMERKWVLKPCGRELASWLCHGLAVWLVSREFLNLWGPRFSYLPHWVMPGNEGDLTQRPHHAGSPGKVKSDPCTQIIFSFSWFFWVIAFIFSLTGIISSYWQDIPHPFGCLRT